MDDRRYAQVSPDSVRMIGESVGVAGLNQSVCKSLAEDVSYRARELAHVIKEKSYKLICSSYLNCFI